VVFLLTLRNVRLRCMNDRDDGSRVLHAVAPEMELEPASSTVPDAVWARQAARSVRAATADPSSQAAEAVTFQAASAFAAALGLARAARTADEESVDAAIDCAEAVFSNPFTADYVGSARMSPTAEAAPAAALFINELVIIAVKAADDGGERAVYSREQRVRALRTLTLSAAALTRDVARQLLPGVASKLAKAAAYAFRAAPNSTSFDRVAMAACEALGAFIQVAFATHSDEEARLMRDLWTISSSAHDEATAAAAAVTAAEAQQQLRSVLRSFLSHGAVRASRDAPTKQGDQARSNTTAPVPVAAVWARNAASRLLPLVEPLARGIRNEFCRGVNLRACPPAVTAQGAQLQHLLGVIAGADQRSWMSEAVAHLAVATTTARQVTNAITSISSSFTTVIGISRPASPTLWALTPHVEAALVGDIVVALKDRTNSVALATLAFLAGLTTVCPRAVARLTAALPGWHLLVFRRVCGALTDAQNVPGRQRDTLDVALDEVPEAIVAALERFVLAVPFDGCVASVADTWKRVTRFVGAQLLPMLDEWDAYETHPAVLRAAAVVVAIAIERLRAAGRRSDEIAAEFVFGGCWQALWSAVRLTRHVWDVGYRFEECTIAQREHRAAVMVAALKLVVTCACCIGGLGTDAAEAWLGDTLFDVLAECANPHDESIRRAAIGAAQSIALLVGGDVAVRRATLKERQTSAARLLTHCADFVVDAALLRVGIPGNEGGFSNPTQWRPLPVAERAAGEAEIAEDEESVSDECTTACRVLRAFLLVSRDGVVEGEAAEVAETGAALQPFITAVMERMTKVVTARVNSETANTAIVLMRDAAIFASLCQRSYDAAVLAGPRPSPFPCPRDGSLPDMANAEYDRQAPLWLQRYHRCLEAALDATLPTVLSAARPGAGREESFLRTRMDALRLAQEVVGALASTVPPRKMESDGEAGELASNDDVCWPSQPPVLRLSDNYLPVAYRLYSMLVRVLDATSASTAVSPAALAERLGALVSSSGALNDDDATRREMRRLALELRQLPLADDESVVTAVSVSTSLLRLAPTFLHQRMRDIVVPLAVLHWQRYCLLHEAAWLHALSSSGARREVMSALADVSRREKKSERVSVVDHDATPWMPGEMEPGHGKDPEAAVASTVSPSPIAAGPRTLRGQRLRRAVSALVEAVRSHETDASSEAAARFESRVAAALLV
jgi:hypothetical protein